MFKFKFTVFLHTLNNNSNILDSEAGVPAFSGTDCECGHIPVLAPANRKWTIFFKKFSGNTYVKQISKFDF